MGVPDKQATSSRWPSAPLTLMQTHAHVAELVDDAGGRTQRGAACRHIAADNTDRPDNCVVTDVDPASDDGARPQVDAVPSTRTPRDDAVPDRDENLVQAEQLDRCAKTTISYTLAPARPWPDDANKPTRQDRLNSSR